MKPNLLYVTLFNAFVLILIVVLFAVTRSAWSFLLLFVLISGASVKEE